MKVQGCWGESDQFSDNKCMNSLNLTGIKTCDHAKGPTSGHSLALPTFEEQDLVKSFFKSFCMASCVAAFGKSVFPSVFSASLPEVCENCGFDQGRTFAEVVFVFLIKINTCV